MRTEQHFFINLAILAAIIILSWWFLFGKKRKKSLAKFIMVEVTDGHYLPAVVRIHQDTEVTLRFIRHDPSACAEKIIFPQLGIEQDLSLRDPTDLKLNIDRAGEFDFTCAMNKYQGKLIVLANDEN